MLSEQCSSPISELHGQVYKYLSPRDLARFSQTSLHACDSVIVYLFAAYNISRCLSHWFDDTDAFRALQWKTGMVVSGLAILSLFERVRYLGIDCDVYVSADYW